MANIAPTITYAPGGQRQLVAVSWAMGIADTGLPAELPAWADRSVQIEGTMGGATIVFEGSNDGTNYRTLTDPQGNAISKTAAAIEQVTELSRYVRPVTSGGTGSAIVVSFLARRTP